MTEPNQRTVWSQARTSRAEDFLINIFNGMTFVLFFLESQRIFSSMLQKSYYVLFIRCFQREHECSAIDINIIIKWQHLQLID